MFSKVAFVSLVGQTLASPLNRLQARQSCSAFAIFGARETTASPGYGSAGTVVNLILGAHSDATAEAIDYPAAGGDSYGTSVVAGTQAVADAVNSLAESCPDTQIVLVGYSQGAQIIDNALCGGGDPNQGISSTEAPISATAAKQVKAAIWMGDPRHAPGASYNVGTSTADGFDPRTGECTAFADIIQSYCDAADPYCSNGSDAAVHQGYGAEYGQDALTFVNGKLSGSSSSSSNSTSPAAPAASSASAAAPAVTAPAAAAPAAPSTSGAAWEC